MQIRDPFLVLGHLDECFQKRSEKFSLGFRCQFLWLSSTRCFFLLESLSVSFTSRFFPGFLGGVLGMVYWIGNELIGKDSREYVGEIVPFDVILQILHL